jgi:hypothetical protein
MQALLPALLVPAPEEPGAARNGERGNNDDGDD